VTDRRGRQGREQILVEVLFVTFLAVMAGNDDAEAVCDFLDANLPWFRKFLILPRGVPAHDRGLRTLAMVKSEEIELVLRTWVTSMRAPGVRTTEGGQAAIDGKTVRGSLHKDSGLSGVHSVSPYCVEAGLTLGTTKVHDKSNEINAIPELIRVLNLKGMTPTIDALDCQKEIAKAIVEAGADYVLQVKVNDKILDANITATCDEATRRRRPHEPKAAFERFADVDKGHGRVAQRFYYIYRNINWIEKVAD